MKKAPPPPADSRVHQLRVWAERRQQIVAYREAGWTYGDIGKHFGISRARAQQIFAQETTAA